MFACLQPTVNYDKQRFIWFDVGHCGYNALRKAKVRRFAPHDKALQENLTTNDKKCTLTWDAGW